MEHENMIVQELLAMGVDEKDIIAEMSIIADLQSRMPFFLNQLTKKGMTEKEATQKIKLANDADPTGNKANYTQWIIKMMLNKSINLPEDNQKVQYAIKEFEKIKKNPKSEIKKDIMTYKTFGELYEVISNITEKDLSKGDREKVRTKEGTNIVYDKGGYKVWEFSTGEAASAYCWNIWGDNIDACPWCFSCAKTAEGYIKNSKIYVVEKGNRPYAAFHLASKQLEDYKADFPPLDSEMWAELYPILQEASGVVILELEDDEFDVLDTESDKETTV